MKKLLRRWLGYEVAYIKLDGRTHVLFNNQTMVFEDEEGKKHSMSIELKK